MSYTWTQMEFTSNAKYIMNKSGLYYTFANVKSSYTSFT